MKHLTLVVLFACSLFATSSLAGGRTHIPADHPNISYLGRVSFTNPKSPCFTYPGVQIRAIFQGTSLSMKAKPNSGYFMVEIDNQRAFKIAFLENDSIISLADGLTDESHEVRITLAYEGYLRRPEFRGFILDVGKTLHAPPVLPEKKIEFIGNSITCGYGVETDNPNAPFKDETENHYYSFAAITARAFDAQSMVVARSGIGIYRNYNAPVTGSPNSMPHMYNQTLFQDPTELWDFSRYTPDVVCINLGTNDVSTKPYDVQLLENAYRDFLATIRGNYPHAQIVLISGCMLKGKALQDVKDALNKVAAEAANAGDRNIYRFDLSPQDGTLGYGASWHPSKAQQRKCAEELIPFIQKITGWEVQL